MVKKKSNLDGRRQMPKAFCPLCHRRAVDAKTAALRNVIALVEVRDPKTDFVFICPNCHRPIGMTVKTFHGETNTYGNPIHPK